MTMILKTQVCSGSTFKNNSTTTTHIITSEYLADSFFNEKDLNVTSVNYFDGITSVPENIDDQRFYKSGSTVITTPSHEIILCIYPRGDLRHDHVNFNMRWYLKNQGVVYRDGELTLPISIHKVDAKRARIKLFDSSGKKFADAVIPLDPNED